MRFDLVPQKGSTYGVNVQDELRYLGIRVADAGVTVYGASTHEGDGAGSVPGIGINANSVFSVPGQTSSGSSSFGLMSKPRPTIANLVANQGKKKSSSQLDHEALQTLTNSLRNVALETEDRKQWYVCHSFFVSIDIVSFLQVKTYL